MIITLKNGTKISTYGRRPVTFTKIDKRWYLEYWARMTGTIKTILDRVPVKHVDYVTYRW